jgi:hypothetical protein
VESLRVGGRDGTKLVDGVKSQVERVREALADDTIPITGVLCFLEADWPLLGGSFTVDDVHVVWPRLLIKRMMEAPVVAFDVDAIMRASHRRFPSRRSALQHELTIHAQRGAVSASAVAGGAGTVSICLGSEFGISGSMRPGWA